MATAPRWKEDREIKRKRPCELEPLCTALAACCGVRWGRRTGTTQRGLSHLGVRVSRQLSGDTQMRRAMRTMEKERGVSHDATDKEVHV